MAFLSNSSRVTHATQALLPVAGHGQLTDERGDGGGEHRTALHNKGHAGSHDHGKVARDPGEGGRKV